MVTVLSGYDNVIPVNGYNTGYNFIIGSTFKKYLQINDLPFNREGARFA